MLWMHYAALSRTGSQSVSAGFLEVFAGLEVQIFGFPAKLLSQCMMLNKDALTAVGTH